ncbi:hypothetical protein GCM10020254_19260 [Streptomyces goshikiensis]
MRPAVGRQGRNRPEDRRRHDELPEHPRSRGRLGRFLGAVPERLPDPAGVPHGCRQAPAGRRPELRVHGLQERVLPLHPEKKGLKFSNGEPLDAKAVKYSLDRIRTIAHKNGPKDLFGSLDKIETVDALTVVFHLKAPDATFPFVLGSPAASLVAPKEYPADKARESDKIVGSGPYVLQSYKEGSEAVLTKNESYTGFANRKNDAVTIRYFAESKKMVDALKNKEIDATYRGLSASEITDLQSPESHNAGVEVVENTGAEIRYLVFNPQDPQVNKLPVRKAIAQIIDRGTLVAKVYQGTAEPLYSMVPKGVVGHKTPFYDVYGHADVAKAKKILKDAGITQPVELTFWYTTDRYGASTADEFTEIKRQLDESGLFKITLRGQPWKTFQEGYKSGQYPVFGRGWFPDFPDPDNFIAPFVGKENAVGTPYEPNEILTDLLPNSRRESDRSAGAKQFEQAQAIFARGRPPAAAVAGQAVRRRPRGHRRRRAVPGPADRHADVGDVPQDQLVAEPRPLRLLPRHPARPTCPRRAGGGVVSGPR